MTLNYIISSEYKAVNNATSEAWAIRSAANAPPILVIKPVISNTNMTQGRKNRDAATELHPCFLLLFYVNSV